jgi:hypothetical protein
VSREIYRFPPLHPQPIKRFSTSHPPVFPPRRNGAVDLKTQSQGRFFTASA